MESVVVKDDDDNYEDMFFGLKFTDGTIAWVNSDEEGNYGGFLEIEK